MTYRITAQQKVALTTTAASSAAFSAITQRLRLCADAACYYSVLGTATTSTTYLPANTVEYITVHSGATISAITGTGTANLHIAEISN